MATVNCLRLPGPPALWKPALEYAAQDPRFAAVLERCAETGWPAGFQADVYTHDLQFFRDNPGREFVCILRELGSNVYIIGEEHKHTRNWAAGAVRYYSGEHKCNYGEDRRKYYHVTQAGAEEITWQRALDFVRQVPDTEEAPDWNRYACQSGEYTH